MKKCKDSNQFDFSGYAEEISGDALFLINGGAEIENSNKGVANAKPGDTLTRNDGTTVTITQGDIDWAKKQVGESETTATNSTPTSVTETSNSQPQQTSSSTSGTGKTNTTTKSGNNSTSAVSSTGTKSTGSSVIQETAATAEQTTSSARTSSEYQGVPPQYWDALDEQKEKEAIRKYASNLEEQNSWNYNPNEPDSDKRYNAKDYNGLHIMTVGCDAKEIFDDFASYYCTVGQYGSAGTTVYDGIGLTDKNGNIVNVLTDEKSIISYAECLNPTYEHVIYSPLNKINPKANSTYIQNNQEKKERALYFEKETSRYGFTSEAGFSKVTSKTLVEGPAAYGEYNLATANMAWMNSPEYKRIGAGVSLISVDGEIGINVRDKRFTIGSGLGIGKSGGIEIKSDSFTLDLTFLMKLRLSLEW